MRFLPEHKARGRFTRRYFFLGALAAVTRAQRAGSYRPDLSMWRSVGSGLWAAEDGEIIGRCGKSKPGKGYLFTREEFTDFRLQLLFWISAGGSSCVYLREPQRQWGTAGDDRPGYGPNCGYAVAINYHDRENPTGALCNLQKPKKVVGSEEEWNEMEIVCRGPEIQMAIGGKNVNRFTQSRVQAGVIGFGVPDKAPEGFEVRFREVVISPVS